MRIKVECPFCYEWVEDSDTTYLFDGASINLRFDSLNGYGINSIFVSGVRKHKCYQKITTPSELLSESLDSEILDW